MTPELKQKPPALRQSEDTQAYDQAFDCLKRLERTLELLMVAGYVSEEKINQAFELAP